MWAQAFPSSGKVYTIKAKFENSANDSYLTNTSSKLTFSPTVVVNGSFWRAVLSGDSSYPWSFQSLADPSKYLNASESSGIGNYATNFKFPASVSGTYYMDGRISGDSRNLHIGTWGLTDSRSGFGRSGSGGCWGTGHANSNWTTDYEITEYLILGDNVVISFLDSYGNSIPDGEVNFTQSNGTVVKLTSASSPYNFGDVAYPVSAFSSAKGDLYLSSVDYIESTPYSRLVFTLRKLSTIVHRRGFFYDRLDATSSSWYPRYGYVGTTVAGDNGLIQRPDGIKEQKTSVFEIPVYLKPGTNRTLYLPSDKINYYQRWYNYDTDGRVDPSVMPALYTDNFKIYANGHLSGDMFNSNKRYFNSPNFTLPESLPTEVIDGKTFYKDYPVAMDISRFKDLSETSAALTEPTLSQRVIYRIMDANKIATKIQQKTSAGQWFETRDIIFPCKKRGEQSNNNTGADLIPLDMDLWNYWVYNSSNQLVQLTNRNQLKVVLDPSSTAQLSKVALIDGTGGISGTNFNQGHFITFTYPQGNVAPDNSVAVINVYFTEGGTDYRLAQFTLRFVPNVEPMLITDVVGDVDGVQKNSRSPIAMQLAYGDPLAEMTFDNARVDYAAPAQGVDHYNQWGGWNSRGQYAFPLDFTMSSYAYGYGSDSGTSRGEYSIIKFSEATGGGVPKYRFVPVQQYYDKLNNTSEFNEANSYFVYVDAADQAGEVLSIPINQTLCAGTRLYCYGWMASNAGASNPASVILSIVGRSKTTGETKILASYCPGILSAWGYREEDNAKIYSFDPNTKAVTTSHAGASNWGLWQQIGFSFLLDSQTLRDYDSFVMQVYNNCYNSSGGDYLLDNFQIFANPPKGEVDFTTPLCSDKVRHAKIHADFNMLKNLANDNEATTLPATFCFLDQEIFDTYTENGMTVGDMFEMDSRGNHNLKSIYNPTNADVQSVINHAFRQALVGSRYTNASGFEDHGFHSPVIKADFMANDPYLYNDSQVDMAYREVDEHGVNRIVFKENVVRGDMQMVPSAGDHHPAYWPHMRPAHTYYLVFSPIVATQDDIDHENTAIQIFNIHESCSFFGKFTTPDPLHIIQDVAEIDSDLPFQAVCHDDEIKFSFDLPALKAGKTIHDEANCTSDPAEDGVEVPGTGGAEHYNYSDVLASSPVQTRIKNLPYDWWFGGSLADYEAAEHPTIKYSHPEDIAHKVDGQPVKIKRAMIDFRFFYPDFGKDKTDVNGVSTLTDEDWKHVTKKLYNLDTGYGLLDSEIAAIKDLVTKGVIILHRNTLNVPLSTANSTVVDGKNVIQFVIHPIEPSGTEYNNHSYLYCPDPQGVTIKLLNASPKMLNGFGDKTYPAEMENVPVRAGLQQINAVSHALNATSDIKTLRVPLRGLTKALEEGKYLIPYEMTAGGVAVETVFLVDSNDPVYFNQLDTKGKLDEAWGKVLKMQAQFGETDNYMDLIFNKNYKMREGYTYRIGVRFVEVTDEARVTRDIACDGILYFDLKVVPEYQVWTGGDGNKLVANITEWTNDRNWARADRSELQASGTKTGDVISGSTEIHDEAKYVANDVNFDPELIQSPDSMGFMPMYFTNVLFSSQAAKAPVLAQPVIAANGFLTIADEQSNRSGFEHHEMLDHEVAKEIAFIKTDAAAADKKVFSMVYDMNVAPVDGSHAALSLSARYSAHDGNYACEIFGTNIAKGLSFAPQTQLINAQYLTYNKAWVEYELDVNRWYTLGSPLQNTFAGEWYAPTKGGQQNSPYFYDITYQQGSGSQELNDRFRPAIYQRSWDSQGNVPVYMKAGGTASWGSNEQGNLNNEPAYVKADWSYVFNEVKKQYSNGGFSVKVNTDLMKAEDKPADDKAIVRLPKADTQYTYYDSDGTTGQHNSIAIAVDENRGRLWSDKLANNAESFTQTITNSSDGNNGTVVNNFFLVNNPFIANMDMNKFFEVNTQFEKKYWIMSADHQIVKVKADRNTWVTTDPDETDFGITNTGTKVGPLQGFFVKTTASTNTTDVKFSAAMQAATEASTAIQTRAASTTKSLNQLAISATRNGYTSTAIVTLSALASNDFKAEEDAQTFVDGNVLSEPTLYTVASDQAMTINTLSNIEVLPLGIVSDDDSEVTLSFNLDNYEGHDLQLFDAETRQLIDLTSDTELSVAGNNNNRYYITRAGALNLFDDRMQNSDDEIYNLQGMQLGTAGKGTVVIINGEKRIVK